ncbi:hypothetical protein TNCV_3158641 [Trichonephila clavipes]|nr:hypothetical protein TNCV_3158641 [Trichonephila clavipes]
MGHNPNIESYWQCKVGARVVGCCAHVASVLWYLDTGAIIPLRQKQSLGYADTLQDAANGWSSDDSARRKPEGNIIEDSLTLLFFFLFSLLNKRFF